MQIKINASEIVIKTIFLQWILNEKFLKIEIEIILNQKEKAWHLIIFFFKKLESAESNYDTHNLKLLVIMQAFKHWRHYLKSNSYSIQMLTDHINLWYFFTTKKLNWRQTYCIEKLVMFDFYIEYWTDKKNSVNEFFKQLNIKLFFSDSKSSWFWLSRIFYLKLTVRELLL